MTGVRDTQAWTTTFTLPLSNSRSTERSTRSRRSMKRSWQRQLVNRLTLGAGRARSKRERLQGGQGAGVEISRGAGPPQAQRPKSETLSSRTEQGKTPSKRSWLYDHGWLCCPPKEQIVYLLSSQLTFTSQSQMPRSGVV